MALTRADPSCCASVLLARTSCAVLYQRETFMADTRLYQQRMLMDPHRPTCDGRSILEMIEDELDAVMERLMSGGDADDARDPGRAEGLAAAIAIIRNPYRPDLDMVRAMAVERWEEAVLRSEQAAELAETDEEYQAGQDEAERREEDAPAADSE